MEAFSIKTQPEDVIARLNDNITFHIETTSDNATYQWQWYSPNNQKWSNSTSGNPTTDTLTVTATQARNGFDFAFFSLSQASFTD